MKEKQSIPAKFKLYKLFSKLFPFLQTKAFLLSICRNTNDYVQFWKWLNSEQNSLVWGNFNIDNVEFSENQNEFQVTVTVKKSN